MKKITVVGGGNAGCFTALYCAWMDKQKDFEVELIYDPEIPPERVGQATIPVSYTHLRAHETG